MDSYFVISMTGHLRDYKLLDNHGVFQNNKIDLHLAFPPLPSLLFKSLGCSDGAKWEDLWGFLGTLTPLTCIWVQSLAMCFERICAVIALKLRRPLKAVVTCMRVRRQVSHVSLHKGCHGFLCSKHDIIERRRSIGYQTVRTNQKTH